MTLTCYQQFSPPPLRQGEPSHSTLLGGLHLKGPSHLTRRKFRLGFAPSPTHSCSLPTEKTAPTLPAPPLAPATLAESWEYLLSSALLFSSRTQAPASSHLTGPGPFVYPGDGLNETPVACTLPGWKGQWKFAIAANFPMGCLEQHIFYYGPIQLC